MSRHFLFVTASARDGGNSLTLARHAAAHLPEGASQAWYDLHAAPLPPFEDLRHAEPGYGPVATEVKPLLDATLAATDIVLVAPLYWYGLPAAAKLYIDHWSHWLRLEGVDFRARMGKRRCGW
ncbi:MAG: NAD(P)H-dependent oxidoreductase [Paracoccaceae bacterium]